MIPKISPRRSSDPGGLINYLFGPGHANEHLKQRTVAGTVNYAQLGQQAAPQVAADLRLPQRLWPQVVFPGGHVWHCSLAIGASEGTLPEARWKAIAEDFVTEMGLADPTKARTRWTAVHHGPSAAGNDHIHLVVNLVREDGSKVSIWQDMVRAQKVVAQLEQRYGLTPLQSRAAAAGAGNVPYTAAEVARSRKSGLPIERVELERRVRVVSLASTSEAEFVRRLREAGVEVRPYPPAGPVTGYSVALPPPPGLPQLFFSGGKVARDLSLPRLRLQWPQDPAGEEAALAEWRQGSPGRPVAKSGRELRGMPATPDALARALHDLRGLAHDLQSASPRQLSAMSADLAGALAAASAVAGPDRRGHLEKASREVASWAGTRQAPAPVAMRGRAATLAFLQAMNPRSEWAKAYMLRQLIEAVMELHQLHRARRAVAGSGPERGVRMSTASDDVDGVFSDVMVVGATATATAVASRARKHSQELAAAARAGVAPPEKGFLRRFKLSGHGAGEPWSPLGDHGPDPRPRGLSEFFSAQDWAALSADQRAAVDPDKVGQWPSEYGPGTPGASLRATADQIKRVGLVGDALGKTGKGAEVANLPRLDASDTLVRLEAELGEDKVRELYHGAGLPHLHRTVVDMDMGPVRGRGVIEWPAGLAPDSPSGSAVPVVEARAAAASEPRHVPVLDDPSTWRTAGEPVRPAQGQFLTLNGYAAADVDRLDKGHASRVIRAHKADGPEAGREAMVQALASMERAAAVASAIPRQQPGPTPGQGPGRTR